MKRTSILILLSILFVKIINAQSPTIVWQKCIGGLINEIPYDIQLTADGGFVFAGLTNSDDSIVIGNHGFDDFYVVKTDSLGNVQFQKCFGGSSSDEATSVKRTHDGGYIITGVTGSNDGDVFGQHSDYYEDGWLVKTDASLNIEWTKTYGGSDDEWFGDVLQTADQGFIIAGGTRSIDGDVTNSYGGGDCWIVKTNSSGEIMWQKSYGGTSSEGISAIKQTADGGFAFVGSTYSNDIDVSGNHGGSDIWVVKIDSLGTIVWQKTLGGSFSEGGNSIENTVDDGCIVSGYTTSNDGDISMHHGTSGSNSGSYDAWLVKINSAGDLEWEKTLGGTELDESSNAIQTSDGGYIMIATTHSEDDDVTNFMGGIEDVWVVKLSSAHEIEWQQTYGGSSDDFCYGGKTIRELGNGKYIIGGLTYSTDGDISGNHGNADCFLIKLDASDINSVNELPSTFFLSVNPNPFSNSTSIDFSKMNWNEKEIEINITDLSGKILSQKTFSNPTQIEIGNDLQPGFYFVEVKGKNNNGVLKILKN
jgi:hypothetical protein